MVRRIARVVAIVIGVYLVLWVLSDPMPEETRQNAARPEMELTVLAESFFAFTVQPFIDDYHRFPTYEELRDVRFANPYTGHDEPLQDGLGYRQGCVAYRLSPDSLRCIIEVYGKPGAGPLRNGTLYRIIGAGSEPEPEPPRKASSSFDRSLI